MPYCDYCHGTGSIPPASAFSLPMKCYRCTGTGHIDWKDLRPGDHVCYIYEDHAEQLKNISQYLAEGIRRRERCYYVFDHHSPEELDKAVSKHGIDPEHEHKRGALNYLSKHESYLVGGVFDAEAIITRWRELAKKSVAAGYTGVRGAAEMSWVRGHADCQHDLTNYELMVDLFFLNEQPRITAVCQYDRRRISHLLVAGARLSHRLVFQEKT